MQAGAIAMRNDRVLAPFEQVILLAILRTGERAYGVPVIDEIARVTGRRPSSGAFYITLDRLEHKGLLRSTFRDRPPDRGGRPRRYLAVTAAGLRALRASRQTLLGLWKGLEPILEAR
jgi:DNA-binding PadR family transcriptional regulator